MKRKVIQIANSTQLVSLPRKWAQMYNIKKGDELDVELDGSRIIVSAEKEPQLKKIDVNLTTADKFLRRSINIPYKLGYDEVNVTYKDPKVIDLIEKEVSVLLGYEVVNQGYTSCLIRNVAETLNTQFDSILKRMFYILISMMEETYTALKEGDNSKFRKIAKMEQTINKFSMFCERTLIQKGYKDYKRTFFVFYMVCQIEHIADDYRDINNYVLEHKIKPSKEMIIMFKNMLDLFKMFHTLFYNFSFEEMYILREKKKDMQKSFLTKFKKLDNPQERYILALLFRSIDRIHHLSDLVSPM